MRVIDKSVAESVSESKGVQSNTVAYWWSIGGAPVVGYKNSSPTRTIAPLNQLIKSAQMIMHSAVLLGKENAALRKACEAVSQHKAHKRK